MNLRRLKKKELNAVTTMAREQPTIDNNIDSIEYKNNVGLVDGGRQRQSECGDVIAISILNCTFHCAVVHC